MKLQQTCLLKEKTILETYRNEPIATKMLPQLTIGKLVC